MELLFTMAHWHGLAKLRMHNDLTLDVMDSVTTSLGVKLRVFSQKTCPAFATKELRREYDARLRREARKSASRSRQNAASAAKVHILDTTGISPSSGPVSANSTRGQTQTPVQAPARAIAGRRFKSINLNTYKFHSYGDYVATIRRHGTMDSYSTEPVCGISIKIIVYR
jgi:hypothetical protein